MTEAIKKIELQLFHKQHHKEVAKAANQGKKANNSSNQSTLEEAEMRLFKR